MYKTMAEGCEASRHFSGNLTRREIGDLIAANRHLGFGDYREDLKYCPEVPIHGLGDADENIHRVLLEMKVSKKLVIDGSFKLPVARAIKMDVAGVAELFGERLPRRCPRVPLSCAGSNKIPMR